MNNKKTAKLLMNGRSQAVRLPKEFWMDGKEVNIQKSGNAVILTPIFVDNGWGEFFERMDQIGGDMPDREPQGEQQERGSR